MCCYSAIKPLSENQTEGPHMGETRHERVKERQEKECVFEIKGPHKDMTGNMTVCVTLTGLYHPIITPDFFKAT